MARKCSVCSHSEIDKINIELIHGASTRDISARFGLDKSSVSRHNQNHLPAHLSVAAEKNERHRSSNLLEEIGRLKTKAERIADQAEKDGDLRTALSGIRELTRIIEILAKMRGEIQNPNLNIVLNAEWIELRAVILNALDEYPAAKIKVAEALKNDNR
jgi:predicted nucleic-acid-binding protein